MKAAELANSIYALYPPFRPWDDATLEAWTNVILEKVGQYTPEVRAKAFKSLTEVEHKNKPPQPATIFEHCREARRWSEEAKREADLPVAAETPIASDWLARQAFADQLVKCPLGLEAAKGGWISTLHSFAAKNRRLPTAAEQAACKREAKEHREDIYPRCVRASSKVEEPAALPLNQTQMRWKILEKIGATMLARGEAKRAMVLKHFGEKV